ELAAQLLAPLTVEHGDRLTTGRGGELAVGAEVLAGGDARAVDAEAGGRQLARLRPEMALDVPVAGRHEADAFTLALDDHAGGDALHPAGAELGHDLLPQHRRDLVAVEPVEDAARLLGVHEAAVDVARVLDGLADRLRRDLVEDHPLDRDLRVED